MFCVVFVSSLWRWNTSAPLISSECRVWDAGLHKCGHESIGTRFEAQKSGSENYFLENEWNLRARAVSQHANVQVLPLARHGLAGLEELWLLVTLTRPTGFEFNHRHGSFISTCFYSISVSFGTCYSNFILVFPSHSCEWTKCFYYHFTFSLASSNNRVWITRLCGLTANRQQCVNGGI